MSPNILITGAAGYIGGTIIAEFLSKRNNLIKPENINAVVRSAEQAHSLAKLGINVLQLDLSNEQAVIDSVLRNEVDIVIHSASSLSTDLAVHLITALGERRKVTGKPTYFIHTSGTSTFAPEAGWPHGEIADSDPIYDLEKQLSSSFPVRQTDITVIEQAKAQDVTSFLVVVPPVCYGEWNKLSAMLPGLIRASILHKTVYKFETDTCIPAVHISDLAAFYLLLVQKVLDKEDIPHGQNGYYFPVAHEVHWWEILDRLAVTLHAQGLVVEPQPQIWPSDEMAAQSLGVPKEYVRLILNSGAKVRPENKSKVGWEPIWNRERFLLSMDDEIQAVRDLGKPKGSLLDSLRDIPSSG